MQVSRTFRIFVSSTFSDMKEERNVLQRHVFPKLRELCMRHGCRFQAVDLRWGIREEASLDQQTMRICFEEIQRCQRVTPRPNFIVLLGDRYGWRPLPYEIPAVEYEGIEAHVSSSDLELLAKWYWRDDNAVPAVYCLQPRTGELADFEKWSIVEAELRKILLRGIEGLGLTGDELAKYVASATEQEIINGLRVTDATEHIFCFFRHINSLEKNLSKDFMDLDHNRRLDNTAHEQLASLKDRLRERLGGNVYEYGADWSGGGIVIDDVGKLCDRVYSSLANIISKEISKLEEIDPLYKEIADHEAFAKERSKFFVGRAGMLKTISEYVKGENRNPLVIFGESGSGKSALMARAIEQVRTNHPNAEVIFRFIGATPRSSEGQSLLEDLSYQIYEALNLDEEKHNLVAKIDYTDEKKAQERIAEIEEEYSIPTNYQKLSVAFRNFLTKIPENRKTVIIIDALNQLSNADHARCLSWIPRTLPTPVRLIASVLPSECLSALETRVPRKNIVELETMPPQEGYAALELRLKDSGRTLQESQRHEVLNKFAGCGLPLYLKLAFDEVSEWKSYTHYTQLSPDIPSITSDLLKRLSSDMSHGATLVSCSLGYLAAAKNGLTEDEMLDILSRDKEVLNDFKSRARHEPPEERLPVVVWSRLYFDLEPYLTERSADDTILLTFYHPHVAKRASEEYLSGESKFNVHQALARYFGSQSLWMEKEGKRHPNKRVLSELPYQQTHGELWSEVEQTLCDLRFIEAKSSAGMTSNLISDYNTALNALPENQEERRKELQHRDQVKKYTEDLIAYARGEVSSLNVIPSIEIWSDQKIKEYAKQIIFNPTRLDRVRAFSNFVNSESHVLPNFAHYSGFCLQQAYNSASFGPVAEAAEKLVNVEKDHIMLLQPTYQRMEYNPYPALIKTLIGHIGSIGDVCCTYDGKLAISASNDKTLRVWDIGSGECLRKLTGHTDQVNGVCCTPDGKLAISASWDKTSRVWDIESGECLRTLTRNTDRVNIVCCTPDGKLAIDRTLRVWDIESGECLRKLTGHNDEVLGVCCTPDGKLAISASSDETLRVWDIDSGECLRTLTGHNYPVHCVCCTPDGKLAISGCGDSDLHAGTLRVWNIESGECLKILTIHNYEFRSVCCTPDGKLAISASWDNILRVWDVNGGKYLRVQEGHTHRVRDVCCTPDGKLAISASSDETLRVWDIESGECLRKLTGHNDEVLGVCCTLDGKLAISASWDRTLRVWDIESGECLRTLTGHNYPVHCVCCTPDGKLAISASFEKTLQWWGIEGSGTLRFWDIESGECLRKLTGHTDQVNGICCTPDGKLAISASWDKSLRIWDINSGECLRTLTGHTYRVRDVCCTPDGKLAISASSDETLRVWDIESGECLRKLTGHNDEVLGVCCTPDGKLAISASNDRTLRIWDIRSGKCVVVYQAENTIYSITTRLTDSLIYGDGASQIIFLRLYNLHVAPPLLTPVRRLLHKSRKEYYRWDDKVTAACTWCGQRFAIDKTLDNFKIDFPSTCPLCNKPIRFNPFIVDKRGLY